MKCVPARAGSHRPEGDCIPIFSNCGALRCVDALQQAFIRCSASRRPPNWRREHQEPTSARQWIADYCTWS